MEVIQELREMNAKLELALDAVHNSVAICDETGSTLYMNRSSEDLLGSSLREKTIGKNYFETLKLKHLLEKTGSPDFKEWKGNCSLDTPTPKSVNLTIFKRSTTNGKFLLNVMQTNEEFDVRISSSQF